MHSLLWNASEWVATVLCSVFFLLCRVSPIIVVYLFPLTSFSQVMDVTQCYPKCGKRLQTTSYKPLLITRGDINSSQSLSFNFTLPVFAS